MANLTDSATWSGTVNEIANTDPVVGGVGGPVNVQATQINNRTVYLKGVVDALDGAETVADHEAKVDPHQQYLTPAEGNAAYDAINAAANAVAIHNAESDPHPQYVSHAEGDAAYDQINSASSAISAHVAVSDPHPQYLANATESLAGNAEIATQAETDAGTDNSRIVTPLKIRFGVSMLLEKNGYIVLPSWLGSLVVQWGDVLNNDGDFIPYNIVFPNAALVVIPVDTDLNSSSHEVVTVKTNNGVLIPTGWYVNSVNSGRCFWIAIGH